MIPLLENKLMRLRATEPEDLELLYRWENDTLQWNLGNANAPFSRYTLKQYLAESNQDIYSDRQLRLMITLREQEKTIGAADLYDFDPFHLRAAVGILVEASEREKGYGLQALQLLEEYAFRFLRLRQLYAFVPVTNKASVCLFEKGGYALAGRLKEWIREEDRFTDVLLMQRINPEG
ncbi:MAG TPA: GNAT family protein [Proteiniphilum sp.]|nr:GNAT family protein [Proteiniphilum sp.]HPD87003.1 GNAT family protein [Proteiniphilum sp.]HPJ51212.1 GNAT family protein [Proteiniphilum sp.]HPR19847.1 GNAT family protein [Proteiniphilum sp.]